MDDRQLRTAWENRQSPDNTTHLSGPLAALMKHTLARRVRALGKLGLAWDEIIPPDLREHTALEGYARGTLTVLVDSASHRFQLEILLKGGQQEALAQRFGGPLNRIKLVLGQFSCVDLAGGTRQGF